MKTLSLSIIQKKMHEEMSTSKTFSLKGIIPDRFGCNFKSLLPGCTTSLFYFKNHFSKTMQ